MSSTIEPEGDGQQFVSGDELKGLLDRWIAPEPSKSLDQRVANSYYTEMGNVVNAAADSIRFPQSQKEVVAMKFCSTCKEEFADKFSFCPVDGTPLSAPVVEPEVVKVATVREPVRPSTPILAAAGSAALVSRGEYHLTMIDDAGLVGRLAKEVTDVAHQYQLTWPEFKRDPFGFTKRSLLGYGQMISKFFANRNVVIAMIVAVLAMAGAVLVVGLLDRSQSAGTSRAGLVGFGVVAGAILISIFATWLRKNQSAAIMGAPESDANNAVFGVIAAFSVLFLLVGAGVFLNFWQQKKAEQQQVADELVLNQLIEIPAEQPTPDPGTAGMAKGSGGGSKPKQEKAGGGGGGGRQEQTPASAGKLPQVDLRIPQVVAPDPHPPVIKNPALPMPATLDADPALFPPDTRQLQYGDPKSKSTTPSSGSGTGNGIGQGNGGGVGPGNGGGYGPGNGGNTGGGERREGGGGPGGGGGGTDYSKIFSGKDVTSKARVLEKPEPTYTEAARKNQITGTAAFSAGGSVTNIHAVSGLPDGLAERAIAAAKNSRFAPATKNGHPVSMWMELQYNFNLY